MTTVEQIAATVLYEGYILWPYRRSARKNQQRWTFGGVFPPSFTSAGDPSRLETQCLVLGDRPLVDVCVRFLQVVERRVGQVTPDGSIAFVDDLCVGSDRYLAWDEAAEREIRLEGLAPSELTARAASTPIEIPADTTTEMLVGPDGQVAGALVRSWESLAGTVEVGATPLQPGLFRLSVAIANTNPWQGTERADALRRAFVSTHTILSARSGEFVSLADPPPDLAAFAARCSNVGTWPVLAGEEGDRRTLLSSPIILYDYPKIAPESPGDLFDGTEIDQLLTLSILTLSDGEKEEMRATDPRARAILARTESLTPEDLMRLHGTLRDFRRLDVDVPVWSEPGQESEPPVWRDLEQPAPSSVVVAGVEVRPGSRVQLRPRAGGDVFDIALAGKIAIVEGIEQDYEERVHLAVTIEDDPGRDLGVDRQIGHRFFFSPDEVVPLDGGRDA